MRNNVVAVLAFTSLMLVMASCGPDSQDPSSALGQAQQSVTVNIPPNAMGMGPAAYGTNPLVIAVGTTVTWVNTDSIAHTATSDTGVWDSGVLNPGQNFSFTFSTPGTFPYHCTIHGAASMSGTIQVTGATPTPTPSVSPSATPSPSPSPSASATPTPTPTMTTIPVPSQQKGTGTTTGGSTYLR